MKGAWVAVRVRVRLRKRAISSAGETEVIRYFE